MFPRYLQYLLTDFCQTFVTGASWDTDDLITFLDQKVKVQGHTIAAEAHSTRRVQLFLVFFLVPHSFLFLVIFSVRVAKIRMPRVRALHIAAQKQNLMQNGHSGSFNVIHTVVHRKVELVVLKPLCFCKNLITGSF